jgi:hypothetical protein
MAAVRRRSQAAAQAARALMGVRGRLPMSRLPGTLMDQMPDGSACRARHRPGPRARGGGRGACSRSDSGPLRCWSRAVRGDLEPCTCAARPDAADGLMNRRFGQLVPIPVLVVVTTAPLCTLAAAGSRALTRGETVPTALARDVLGLRCAAVAEQCSGTAGTGSRLHARSEHQASQFPRQLGRPRSGVGRSGKASLLRALFERPTGAAAEGRESQSRYARLHQRDQPRGPDGHRAGGTQRALGYPGGRTGRQR